MANAKPYHTLTTADKARRLSSDVEAEYLEGNLSGLADTLAELAEEIETLKGDALRVAALVSNAALKHTAGPDRHDDRGAVGRMHNAARHARMLLDLYCPSCVDAKSVGLPAAQRDGATCGDCARILGDLGGSQ